VRRRGPRGRSFVLTRGEDNHSTASRGTHTRTLSLPRRCCCLVAMWRAGGEEEPLREQNCAEQGRGKENENNSSGCVKPLPEG
jgi:hypothetical protein